MGEYGPDSNGRGNGIKAALYGQLGVGWLKSQIKLLN